MNPNAFWRYSNSRLKTKAMIGDLPNASSVLGSGNKAKTEVLNNFFQSAFTQEDGPDGIHPQVLQETCHSICTPLAHLYCRSLDKGELPGDWTLGRIVPIFKNGAKHEPGNYQPVSLTSITCKVLESLIFDSR